MNIVRKNQQYEQDRRHKQQITYFSNRFSAFSLHSEYRKKQNCGSHTLRNIIGIPQIPHRRFVVKNTIFKKSDKKNKSHQRYRHGNTRPYVFVRNSADNGRRPIRQKSKKDQIGNQPQKHRKAVVLYVTIHTLQRTGNDKKRRGNCEGQKKLFLLFCQFHSISPFPSSVAVFVNFNTFLTRLFSLLFSFSFALFFYYDTFFP